jgi:hypothetical protein
LKIVIKKSFDTVYKMEPSEPAKRFKHLKISKKLRLWTGVRRGRVQGKLLFVSGESRQPLTGSSKRQTGGEECYGGKK